MHGTTGSTSFDKIMDIKFVFLLKLAAFVPAEMVIIFIYLFAIVQIQCFAPIPMQISLASSPGSPIFSQLHENEREPDMQNHMRDITSWPTKYQC